MAGAAPPGRKNGKTEDAQRQLIFAAQDLELRIARSKQLYGHENVDSYLQSVASKLLRPGESARIRAIKSVSANAFALPNGSVYVTTQLLLQLRNEAQLACVIGHELTHIANSHALKERISGARKASWIRGLAIVFAAALGAATNDPNLAQGMAGVAQETGELLALASISGYSRELETEADREGMARVLHAGYDATKAASVFEVLRAAADQEEAPQERPYFSSHPKLSERMASYQQLLAELHAGETAGFDGGDEYARQVGDLEFDQIRILIDAREFSRAGALIARRYSSRPPDGATEFLRGEVARLGSESSDPQNRALAAYDNAIRLGGAPADAFRQKGLIHRQQGEHSLAVAAFVRYLELDPGAIDAPLVRLYLSEQGKEKQQ
jgi:Zn-dependent protease with chaperone function